MRNEEALRLFEKRGRAAGFLCNCGNPESQANAEKRIDQAMAIYYAHPHLQEKMHDIALSFSWSFVARLEQKEYLQKSVKQRGARLC